MPFHNGESNTAKVAVLMPVRERPFRIAPYWIPIFNELHQLDVRAEVIWAQVRAVIRDQDPPPERRAYLPSLTFVRVLLRSSAPVFFCVEYSFATLLAAVAARLSGRHTI